MKLVKLWPTRDRTMDTDGYPLSKSFNLMAISLKLVRIYIPY